MSLASSDFPARIRQGIPEQLPPDPVWDAQVNHAPRRKDILSVAETDPKGRYLRVIAEEGAAP